ncbi:MAG TPA: sigma-70 family RNA polymerase sigma factor [Acidobacteriota bacterium]
MDKAVALEENGIVNHDPDPFEAFFQQNYKKVYGILYRLTGHKMDAEDLTVETFLKYLQERPPKLDHPEGWLFRVATRLGFNALRSAKRRTQYETKAALHFAGSNTDPAQELERDQKRAKVHAVLRKMDQRNAEIILLYHTGCSYKEIAAAVDVSPTSIGTLLTRAQKQFESLYLKER